MMAFNILGSPTMARRCVVQLGALDILPISRSPMDQLHDALGGLVLQSKQTVQSGAKDLRRVKTLPCSESSNEHAIRVHVLPFSQDVSGIVTPKISAFSIVFALKHHGSII
jgi:hypothetical protein